jgi:hypothetical protein
MQSRGTVEQALERIRKAARETKKERFTALLHHISPNTWKMRLTNSSQTQLPAWTA